MHQHLKTSAVLCCIQSFGCRLPSLLPPQDGSVVRWDAQAPGPDAGAPKVPMHDAYNDYY